MSARCLQLLVVVLAAVGAAPNAQSQLLPGSGGGEAVEISVAETHEDRMLRRLQEREASFVAELDRLYVEFSRSREARTTRLDELEVALQVVSDELESLSLVLAPRRAGLLRELRRAYRGELQIHDRVRAVQSELIEELNFLIVEANFFSANMEFALEGEGSILELDAFIESLEERVREEGARAEEVERARWEHIASMTGTLNRYRDAESELDALETQFELTRAASTDAAGRAGAIASHLQRRADTRAATLAELERSGRRELLARGAEGLLSTSSWLSLIYPWPPVGWWSPLERIALLAELDRLFSRASEPPLGQTLRVARTRVLLASRAANDAAEAADPEGDLPELELRVRRQFVSVLAFQRELDRIEFQRIGFDLAEISLRLPFLRHSIDGLEQRRTETRLRALTDLRRRDKSWFYPPYVDLFLQHTALLFDDPAAAIAQARFEPAREPLTPLAVFFIALAAAAGLWPLARTLRRRRAQRDADGPAPRVSPLAVVMPVCIGLLAALALGVVPGRHASIVRFVALVPLLLGFSGWLVRLARERAAEGAISAAAGAWIRVCVRLTVTLVIALSLVTITLRFLGHPFEATRPLQGVLLLIGAAGILAILVPRRAVLTLLKLSGREGSARPLRRLLALAYPLLAILIVFPVVVLVLGYTNLASVVVRRGLALVVIGMFLPVFHERLHQAAQAWLGFTGEGGVFGDNKAGAQRAYRALAPVLTVLVGLVTVAVVVILWAPEEGGEEFFGTLTAPLVVLGENEVTILSVFGFVLAIVVTVMFTRWLEAILRQHVYPLYDLTEGMRATFDTLIRYTLYTIGVLVGLKLVGVPLGTLAIFAGVIGIGIGFGSQTLIGNFIAGLILQFSRSISVGDTIEVEGVVGRIRRISGAATVVRTYENLSVVIPNATFVSNSVVNWTESSRRRRLGIKVGVAYGSDLGLVRELLISCALGQDLVLEEPAPTVHFDDFGESSLDMTLLVWIADADRMRGVATKIRYKIDAALREAGVEIPFPQRDLHVRTDEETRSTATEHGWDVIDEEELAIDNPEIEPPEEEGEGEASDGDTRDDDDAPE